MSAGWRRRMVRENRIYILPSGRGALFLGVVVILILTAATYNNNLIYILAFFLFAMFVVSMLQTHYLLKGVRLVYVGAEEAFEGGPQELLFHLTQSRARWKRGLEIRTRSKRFETLDNRRETIAPGEPFKPVRIQVRAWRRGVHPMPEMILESYFPLGLFRAWKVFRPVGELVVYPRPHGTVPLASRLEADPGEHEIGMSASPDGDFGELKPYRVGESYRQIAWKHYARTGELHTKQYWGSEQNHYRLPWAPPPRQSCEDYLRQLSQWIRSALDEGASFELETPEGHLPPGQGEAHARLCWRALARVEPGRRGA